MNLNYDSLIGSGFNPFSEEFRKTLNDLARVVGRWSEAEEAIQQLLAKEERVFEGPAQYPYSVAAIGSVTPLGGFFPNRWEYTLVKVSLVNGEYVSTAEELGTALNTHEFRNTAAVIGGGQSLQSPASVVTVGPIVVDTVVIAFEDPLVSGHYLFGMPNPITVEC